MPIQILFWCVMFIWLIFGALSRSAGADGKPWIGWGVGLLPFIAICLLGWQTFGDAIT